MLSVFFLKNKIITLLVAKIQQLFDLGLYLTLRIIFSVKSVVQNVSGTSLNVSFCPKSPVWVKKLPINYLKTLGTYKKYSYFCAQINNRETNYDEQSNRIRTISKNEFYTKT